MPDGLKVLMRWFLLYSTAYHAVSKRLDKFPSFLLLLSNPCWTSAFGMENSRKNTVKNTVQGRALPGTLSVKKKIFQEKRYFEKKR